MATISTYRNDVLPSVDQDVYHVQKSVALPASGVNNADAVEVFKFPVVAKCRIINCVVRAAATLGVSATVQARVNRGGVFTTLTAATSAGAASKVDASAQVGVPFTVQGGDVIELLVGGANVSSAATVTVDFGVANYSNANS